MNRENFFMTICMKDLEDDSLKMDALFFESCQNLIFVKDGTEKGHLIGKALSLIDTTQLKGKKYLTMLMERERVLYT